MAEAKSLTTEFILFFIAAIIYLGASAGGLTMAYYAGAKDSTGLIVGAVFVLLVPKVVILTIYCCRATKCLPKL